MKFSHVTRTMTGELIEPYSLYLTLATQEEESENFFLALPFELGIKILCALDTDSLFNARLFVGYGDKSVLTLNSRTWRLWWSILNEAFFESFCREVYSLGPGYEKPTCRSWKWTLRSMTPIQLTDSFCGVGDVAGQLMHYQGDWVCFISFPFIDTDLF